MCCCCSWWFTRWVKSGLWTHQKLFKNHVGPSVLDVFRTLVKHLRISIQGPFVPQTELHVSSDDSQKFQKSITKTVGEFAGVLPDYHKPDIMSLINSYMVVVEPSANQPVALESADQTWFLFLFGVCYVCVVPLFRYQLASSLVQCLKAVADTYHPAILDPTFPDTLFTSLVELFTIENSSKCAEQREKCYFLCSQIRCAVGCNGFVAPVDRSPSQ